MILLGQMLALQELLGFLDLALQLADMLVISLLPGRLLVDDLQELCGL